MRTLLSALAMASSLMAAGAAIAAERTVTFAVENMYCAACPYTVRSAMAAVAGVTRVEVSFEKKSAAVTFDDAKTTIDSIGASSTDAGYHAHVVTQGN
jgi:mercuric ion binding protein